MFQSRVLGPQGGILRNGGNGTFGQKNVPKQYQLNLAEPSVKSVGVLRGASASAAPIIAVNKERYDNRSSKKQYETKVSSQNLTYFLDFRDAMKIVSGTESTTHGASLKPDTSDRPIPTHSTPIHRSFSLFVQACIDMNYGKDNSLYDNTSKSLKFSTPANGRIVPERQELFGMLLDDLKRISNGQFPVHTEWFGSYGTKMTPSKAKDLLSLLERISRLIQFTKEKNTWLGKGCDHLLSIMNALLTKNLLQPGKYNKQKYFSHFYHINEMSYDDNQGRAIRGEPKPTPLQNATLGPLPFPSPYIQDILLSFRQEAEAAKQDMLRQAELAARMAAQAIATEAAEIAQVALDKKRARQKKMEQYGRFFNREAAIERFQRHNIDEPVDPFEDSDLNFLEEDWEDAISVVTAPDTLSSGIVIGPLLPLPSVMSSTATPPRLAPPPSTSTSTSTPTPTSKRTSPTSRASTVPAVTSPAVVTSIASSSIAPLPTPPAGSFIAAPISSPVIKTPKHMSPSSSTSTDIPSAPLTTGDITNPINAPMSTTTPSVKRKLNLGTVGTGTGTGTGLTPKKTPGTPATPSLPSLSSSMMNMLSVAGGASPSPNKPPVTPKVSRTGTNSASPTPVLQMIQNSITDSVIKAMQRLSPTKYDQLPTEEEEETETVGVSSSSSLGLTPPTPKNPTRKFYDMKDQMKTLSAITGYCAANGQDFKADNARKAYVARDELNKVLGTYQKTKPQDTKRREQLKIEYRNALDSYNGLVKSLILEDKEMEKKLLQKAEIQL